MGRGIAIKLRANPPLAIVMLAVIFRLFLNPVPHAEAATTSGAISADEVWSGTLDVTGDVVVEQNVSLRIEAGALIRFADNAGLRVYGRLEVLGTAANPVRFTSASSTATQGIWTGITLNGYGPSTISTIEHAVIEYAATGLWCGSANSTVRGSTFSRCVVGVRMASSMRVEGCTITESQNFGIFYEGAGNAELVIADNHIARCGTGIYVSGAYGYGDVTIRNNIVRDNNEAGINVNYVSSAKISFNTVLGNTYGIVLSWAQTLFATSSNILASNGCGIRFIENWGSCTLDHNDFWNNHAGYSGLPAGDSDISADPLFAGAADFHLQPGSPCIDAGDPAVPDPDSSRSDIGAYGAGGNPPPESADDRPHTPVNVFPAEGASVTPPLVTLTASPFFDPDAEDGHGSSRWMVRAGDGSRPSPTFDSGERPDALTSISIPISDLQADSPYLWQVRFKDSRGGWSDYSQATSFKTLKDLDPPETTILYGPAEGSFIAYGSPSFTWEGRDDYGGPLTYSHAVDSTDNWSAFESFPYTAYTYLSGLGDGPHTFYVRARDHSGNVDPTPAVRNFTVDTTLPLVGNVSVSQITIRSAVVSWETDEPATTQVRYGYSTAYEMATPLEAGFVTLHSAALDNLSGNTTYHFSVQSRDRAGNPRDSKDFTLKTLPVQEKAPPETNITQGPQEGSIHNTRSVTITWTGLDDTTATANLVYASRLDGSQWSAFTNATSQTVTNLTDGSHSFEVKARDQAGKEDPTPATRRFQVDATPPDPATDFASQPSQTGADLQWAPSPSADVSSYRLYWDKGLGVIDYASPCATVGHPGNTLSAVLPNRGVYRFGVRAVDLAGNEEKNTNLVTFVALTRPDAPTLKPVSSPTVIPVQTLSGTKDPDTSLWVNGFEVIQLNGSTTWSHEVTLAVGVNRLELTCRNAGGEQSPPVAATIEYDALPLPVSTLRADGHGSGTTVALSWQGYDEAGQKDIASYRVYAAEQPFAQVGGMTPKATLAKGDFHFTITNLIRSRTYYFAVVAFDVRGNVNTAVTPVSAVPTDIVPPEPPASLRVECSADRLVFAWSPSADTARDLAGYKVVFNAAPALTLPSSALRLEQAGLAPARSYPFTVAAVDSSGNESAGLSLNGVTLLENPGALTLEPFDGKVTLSWTGVQPKGLLAHYQVYISPSPFTNVSDMTPRTKVTTTSASIAGLTNGTPYHFAVTAVNLSGGEGKNVAAQSATPEGDKQGPAISDVRFESAPLAVGSVLRNSGTFSLTATDPAGVSRTEFYLDGTLRHTDTNGSSRYTYPWSILTVDDGSHVLTLKAFDTLGNSTAMNVSVQVSMSPPGPPTITAPATGALTNKDGITVSGRADKSTELLIARNGIYGDATLVDSAGNFSTPLRLAEGENRIRATARNRGGMGPQSNEVVVTLDSTLPRSPENLTAQLLSGGSVRLAWRAPAETAIKGYNLYRATTPFDSTAGAVKVSASLLTGTSFDNLPPTDGTYHYRATTVDRAGNESEFSNGASVVVDKTAPRAASIQYLPSGPMDPGSGRIGQGLVTLRLAVTEPLLTTPFLSITPHEGLPIAVDLSKTTDTEYMGSFTITDTTPSGPAQAVFSARDPAGNRGTEIMSGGTLLIDASGPTVTQISIEPAQPVKNDRDNPVTVSARFGLSEPSAPGSPPEISFLLSGPGRNPIAIHSISQIPAQPGQAECWSGTFVLPADAGAPDVETLLFAYRGRDDLGNVSHRILAENRFQLYQGDLPPLDPPSGFAAKALPGGRVKLSWQPTPGAADYQLYRKGPGDSDFIAYLRPGNLHESIDTPGVDGTHLYAVASVRRENDQEAVSGMCAPVPVSVDSIAPDAPRGLSLALISRGINCVWQPPLDTTEPVTYSLYRADRNDITTVEGLTPIIKGIKETTVLDPKPSVSDHCYAVTAVDAAGNESPPSNSYYLNFGLLPVSSIKVARKGMDPPVISWTPPAGSSSATVAGYNLDLGSSTGTVRLNTDLLSTTSFTDAGYAGDERAYTVTAVDDNGVSSLGRSISLPVVDVLLNERETLKRGVMNRLDFTVSNRSSAPLERVRLKVQVGSHSGVSEEFQLPPRESLAVPVSFGGYADLQDLSTMTLTLSLAPHESELIEISRSDEVEVTDGMLVLQILSEEFTRGGAGKVRFVLENTGEEDIEVVTATGSGASPSNEITFTLRDLDGNVLSSKGYRQSMGAGVVTLANGSTVARIPAGGTFTSDSTELAVPLCAPERVRVEMTIKNLYHHQGRPEQVAMQGLSTRHDVALVDTSYSGTVTSVSPEVSNGEQDILIAGKAIDRATGLMVAQAPLNLVIVMNGYERSHKILTDADGAFTFTFKPLPTECGQYTVFAVHPDVSDKPAQARFVINRVTLNPQTLNLNLPRNFEKAVSIQVSAGDGTEAHNVRLVRDDADQPDGRLPEGIHLTVGAPVARIGSRQTGALGFSLWADNSAAASARILFKVKSDESVEKSWGTVMVNLQFSESQPALYFTPNHVETGVSFGGTASESVTLENRGLADLTDVSFTIVSQDGSLPPPWVHLNVETATEALTVGEKRPVGLSFTPTADSATEGIHTFYVRIESSNYRRTDIPVFVTVTQSGSGNALFKVSDIYTGTVDSRGKIVQGLSDASITVQNEQVPTIQRTLATDGLGEAFITQLPSGRYKVKVTASNHQEHGGRVWIKPGITLSEPVFLDYNLVTVEWEVVETTLQDRYEIVLTATFETNVPAAVVVAEPSSVHLPQMKAGDVYQGEFALSNFGLIRADKVRFAVPNGGERFKYELLSPVPGSLNAKERITVPFRVTCLRSFNPAADGTAGGGGCDRTIQWGRLTYDYTCSNGNTTANGYPYCAIVDVGECTSSPVVPGVPGSPGGGGGTWDYTYSGGGGTVGPAPAPGPTPIEGAKCLLRADRDEDETEDCRPETKQDVEEEVGSSVHCVLREYRDEVVDLSVKVPGGSLTVTRTYTEDRWQFEDLRHNLELVYDALGQSLKSIDKGGVLYERSTQGSSSPVFVHGTYRIRSAPEGYLWETKHGSWKSFDGAGRLTAYGTSNGPVARLIHEPGASGRLVGVADRNDRQVFWFEYNDAGALSAAFDLAGRRVEYGYGNERLTRVTDVLGNTTAYAYDAAGRMVKKTDPLGRSELIAYDRTGTVSRVTDAQGHGHFFQFDFDNGRKEFYAQIKTSSGRIKEVWYDRQGDTKRVDINGRTVRKITKDGRNLLITDESGNVTRKEFDEWQNPTKIVHPDGSTVLIEYERKLNHPIQVTDEMGTVTHLTYDEAGNPLVSTEATGTSAERMTEYSYDARGLVTSVKGLGDGITSEATTSMDYDAAGNLIAVRDPEGAETRFTHDSMGKVLTRTNPEGKAFNFTYDAAGRLTSGEDPMGHRSEIRRDGVGNVIQRIDAEGKSRTFQYDGHNRLAEAIDTAGNATIFEYDMDGRLTRRTDPEGKVLAYRYDARGRLAAAIDGNGNEIRVDYADGLGCGTCRGGSDKPARITFPTFVKEFQYDSRGRKVQEKDILSATESTLTRFEYDAAGNLVTLVDKESRTTRYNYDPLGRLISAVEPLGSASAYAYDDRDSVVSLTDANGNRMRFEYDRNNRLVRETRPMGQETSYAYDALGQLIRRTNPKGQSAVYHYDDAGRLAALQFYAASDPGLAVKTVTFTRDKVGTMTGYDDGLTSAVYTFDDAYRKVHEALNYGPFQLSSATTWYRNGAMKSFTGPTGVTTGYTYDPNNQLSSVEIPDRGFITYNEYQWFRPAKETLPGGTTRQYAYDPLMRLKALEVRDPAEQILMGTTHAYDKMDNLVARKTEHGDTSYTYDDLYRLIKTSHPDRQAESFSYDPAGNRLTAENVLGSWTYNRNNELLGHENTAFSYDQNGNTIEKVTGTDVLRYHYDVEDHLERVETGSGHVIARYGYDPFGRRLWKDVGGRKTYFFYAAEGLVGEYDETGTELKSYGYKPGSVWTTDPLFMKQGSEYYFYQNDHLGTPTLLTAANGNVVWSAKYSVFGEAQIEQLSISTNNLRLPGQYYDQETGYHYNNHRYYDPTSGRYPTPDPIGLTGGINLYLYVQNDPINRVDPVGLRTYTCKQPLHAFGGKGNRSGPDIWGNPFYHQFLCVIESNGTITCGGQDRSGGLFSPGQPSQDSWPSNYIDACGASDDRICVDQCVKKKILDPKRPYYGIPFGTDCQEWSSNALNSCQAECEEYHDFSF